ncbi:hypothetical protein [Kitasatospora sp. KL5]|uniref:hypothetical protein n=1 Tax=Kitasatospora sp. KL5 TaxID=3425125 RepID=UPI003D7020B1
MSSTMWPNRVDAAAARSTGLAVRRAGEWLALLICGGSPRGCSGNPAWTAAGRDLN